MRTVRRKTTKTAKRKPLKKIKSDPRQTRLVVLTSGQGRVLGALIERCEMAGVSIKISGVIGSRPNIGATEMAGAHGIPVAVLDKKTFENEEAWDKAILAQLIEWEVEWILLSGYLNKLGPKVLEHFPHRIVNSHPSLLPKFGGQGMYGRRVHEAVIAAKEKVTGITVHLVDANYDEGPILAQKEVLIATDETAESLEKKVVEAEKIFVAETIVALCSPQ